MLAPDCSRTSLHYDAQPVSVNSTRTAQQSRGGKIRAGVHARDRQQGALVRVRGGAGWDTDLALVGRDGGRQGLLKALPGLSGREPALLRGESALLRGDAMPIISATSLNSAASARSRDRLLDSLLICTFCSFCTSPMTKLSPCMVNKSMHSMIDPVATDNQANVLKRHDSHKDNMSIVISTAEEENSAPSGEVIAGQTHFQSSDWIL